MSQRLPSRDDHRVSVALCAYNGQTFIAEQLRSILAQTRLPDEIVVVDDGSTDDTLGIISSLAATASMPIRLHRNETNRGVVRNFERAVGLATGDVIFLADQDDVWPTVKIERMLAGFDDPSVLLVHSDARLVDAQLRDLGSNLLEALEMRDWERERFQQGRGLDVLIRCSLVTGAATAIRRDLLAAAIPFAANWVHDEWLAVMAALVGRIGRIDEPLLQYRQHAGNQIGARRRGLVERYVPNVRLPRAARKRRVERLQELHRRGSELSPAVDRSRLALIEEGLAHAKFRAELPGGRLRRPLPVAREFFSGRYGRYSNGWRGALRDLVEPLTTEDT